MGKAATEFWGALLQERPFLGFCSLLRIWSTLLRVSPPEAALWGPSFVT